MRWLIILTLLLLTSHVHGASNYYEGDAVISPTPSALSVGGSYTEPTTGATITRLTDHTDLTPDLPDGSLVVYSRFSPINSSGEYALVHGTDSTSAWVLRLSDNTIIHKVNPGSNVNAGNDEIGENHEIRWDYTGDHPNRVYFVYGTKFYQMDVINGNDTSTELYDATDAYPTAYKIINDVEGDSSADSRYWAWQVLGPYTSGKYPVIAFIVYDKTSDALVGQLEPGDVTPTQNASAWADSFPYPNMVEVSPDGDRVMLNYHRCYSGSPTEDWCDSVFDGAWVFDLDFTNPVKVGITETHAGWAFKDDKQLFIHHMNRTQGSASDTIQACYTDGTGGVYPNNCFNMLEFADYNYLGVHWGRMKRSHQGWIFGATYSKRVPSIERSTSYTAYESLAFYTPDNTYQYQATVTGTTASVAPTPPASPVVGTTYTDGGVTWRCRGAMYLDNQLFMLELVDMEVSTPRIWRIGPVYNHYDGNYRDEAPAAISTDMKTVLLTSNWNEETPLSYPAWSGGEVYEVELPTDWLSVLSGTETPAQTATSWNWQFTN